MNLSAPDIRDTTANETQHNDIPAAYDPVTSFNTPTSGGPESNKIVFNGLGLK